MWNLFGIILGFVFLFEKVFEWEEMRKGTCVNVGRGKLELRGNEENKDPSKERVLHFWIFFCKLTFLHKLKRQTANLKKSNFSLCLEWDFFIF
mgnify:CR=1 FL=1